MAVLPAKERNWHTTGVFGTAASESVDGGLRDTLSAWIAMPFVTRTDGKRKKPPCGG